MYTHSSTLAWKIPWTEEPGQLQSMESLRVGHWLSDFTFTFHFHALEKEMATHSSVLAWRIPGTGEPGGLPSVGSHSRTRLKRLSSSSNTTPGILARKWQKLSLIFTSTQEAKLLPSLMKTQWTLGKNLLQDQDRTRSFWIQHIPFDCLLLPSFFWMFYIMKLDKEKEFKTKLGKQGPNQCCL